MKKLLAREMAWLIIFFMTTSVFAEANFLIPVRNYALESPPNIIDGLASAARAKDEINVDISGLAGVEGRFFFNDPLDARQHGNAASFVLQPEYYREWDDGRQSLTIEPFVRFDSEDDERSHADLRELLWLKVGDNWELRAGIGKVFWGVTESQHLVDIINQTDLVDSIDGEEKLGQPMIDVSLIRDWGTLDIFALPGFRERTFAGVEGRLRTPLPVDSDQAVYQSDRKDRRVDFALRWFRMFGDWEIGLSHFNGTAREPVLLPIGSVMVPRYELLRQTGVDVQLTTDAWLWKLETVSRHRNGEDSSALTAGFEYTYAAVRGSNTDIGLIAEYLFDDLDDRALTPFEDDVMVGMRLAFNDVQSSELLAGVIFDIDSDTKSYSIEASRRLGASWKLNGEMHLFDNAPPDDLSYALRKDDFAQLELLRYF